MKKYFLLTLISFALYSCSSIELEAVSTSAEETQRILAMGLSHEDNLIEAKKLKSSHMTSVVILQLTNARDEKIQAEMNQVEAEKFADLVSVLEGGSLFIGTEVSESLENSLSPGLDFQNFNLVGTKNLNSNIISHKLHVIFVHESSNKRDYLSANICDDWKRCDSDNREINLVSVNATNCTAYSCQYEEVVELNLSDEFLNKSINNEIRIRFNAKKKSNLVIISKPYLMGYLKVAI